MTAEELYEKLKHCKIGGTTCRFSLERCQKLVPLINDINRLKKEKNAVILAHSYVSPEIIYGVADYTGDSYGLSKDAMNTDAETIVFVAVKFMGDTAKILNPEKEVLIPSELNGCSLADSITGEQVRTLRSEYPDHTFVCYINTTADVKAECDVCVTSSNVYDIVERIPNDKIYFLPDRLMGENIIEEMARRGVKKDIALWDGTCYVHEDYDPEIITYLRMEHPKLRVLSHPECSPNVLKDSDFIGSTTQMLNYVKTHEADAYLMLTECGLISRLEVEAPDKTFVGTCTMCKYMKSNTLEDIKRVLEKPEEKDRIVFDEAVRLRALQCINKMFEYTEGAAALPTN
jgi:quinolinate synthase